ncbi:MAG: hypothetical protein ACYDH1_17135 [Anaerolineaceae bacterium]|jgi:hypothetical protein|nr:MAG: hypothetical protein CVU46_16130 [Chloroflexi bacterium HGW-Chloroflexi-8]
MSNAHWKEVAEAILVEDWVNKDAMQNNSQTSDSSNKRNGKKNEQNDDPGTSKYNQEETDNCAIELGI